MTDLEFIVSFLSSGCPPISTRAVKSQVIKSFWNSGDAMELRSKLDGVVYQLVYSISFPLFVVVNSDNVM